ncbi:hypothetical protein [Variovorax sp. E3]|uniref:hypothetical protein n=1 Tax=Variovorax sp. E3 TaxID=1914993 RepID=UPI0022B66C04|nr:hypothetical protein [Variovorax sp. E3]
MKRLLPSLLAAAAIASLATFAVAPAHAQGDKPKDKVTLMLNWYLYSEHAPFFLGKEKAFTPTKASTWTSRKAAAPPSPRRRWPPSRPPSATSTSPP